jgi:tetratricopeptide (TPR) repeat protein
MRVPAKAILVSVLVLVALAAASEKPTLKSLYDQHRWFELREAIKNNKQAPALYLGALASAFNETKEAEKDLNRAIALAPNSDDAVEAHETLGYLYARSGRYREVVQQLDSILKIKPGRADVANVRTIYAAFSRHPDLSLGRARRATVTPMSAKTVSGSRSRFTAKLSTGRLTPISISQR